MNKLNSTKDKINIIGCIADLKEVDYQNTLALSALIELLISKQIISREEIEQMCLILDSKID